MTKLLDAAFARISKLPPEDQNAVASFILKEIESPEIIHNCVANICRWHNKKGQALVELVSKKLSVRLGCSEKKLREGFEEYLETSRKLEL